VRIVRGTSVGQRSETVRRSNLSVIVRALHADGPLSRSDLVARTGLTRSAIRTLVGELAAAGLVAEEPSTPHGVPGRPSPVVRLHPRRACVLVLEIAVDTLAGAVVGLGGEIHDRIRVDGRRHRPTLDEIATDLVGLAEALRGRGSFDDERLIGIGVAVVGVVRRSDGFVSMAPNLGWRDVPLGQRLVEALSWSVPVAVANEADLGARRWRSTDEAPRSAVTMSSTCPESTASGPA
jgi:hypothetical protein